MHEMMLWQVLFKQSPVCSSTDHHFTTNYAFRFVHHCTLLFVLHVACDDFLAFSPTSV